MIRRPPRSTQSRSSAASDVYKRQLPGHVSLHKHRIDYSGATLLVAAAVPLLLAFSWAGSEYAWSSWQIVSLFAFSGAMWLAFYLRELRAAEPVINPRLFQNSIFRVSALASMLQSACLLYTSDAADDLLCVDLGG